MGTVDVIAPDACSADRLEQRVTTPRISTRSPACTSRGAGPTGPFSTATSRSSGEDAHVELRRPCDVAPESSPKRRRRRRERRRRARARVRPARAPSCDRSRVAEWGSRSARGSGPRLERSQRAHAFNAAHRAPGTTTRTRSRRGPTWRSSRRRVRRGGVALVLWPSPKPTSEPTVSLVPTPTGALVRGVFEAVIVTLVGLCGGSLRRERLLARLNEAKIDAGIRDAAVRTKTRRRRSMRARTPSSTRARAVARPTRLHLDQRLSRGHLQRRGTCVFNVCRPRRRVRVVVHRRRACSVPRPTASLHDDHGRAGSVGCNATRAHASRPRIRCLRRHDRRGRAYPVNDLRTRRPSASPSSDCRSSLVMTAMGSRVYFVARSWAAGRRGEPSGVGGRPVRPLTKQLQASSAFDTATEGPSSRRGRERRLAVPRRPGFDPLLPIAEIAAPSRTTTPRFFPSPGVPTNAAPVVPSGSRIVIARNDPSRTRRTFSFETAPPRGTRRTRRAVDADGADGGRNGPHRSPGDLRQGPMGPCSGTPRPSCWSTEECPHWRRRGSRGSSRVRRRRRSARPNIDVEVYAAPQLWAHPSGPVAWSTRTRRLSLLRRTSS